MATRAELRDVNERIARRTLQLSTVRANENTLVTRLRELEAERARITAELTAAEQAALTADGP